MAECPDCGEHMVDVEYSYGSPQRYDGISEHRCVSPVCGTRIGRWSGKKLAPGEEEKRYGGKS